MRIFNFIKPFILFFSLLILYSCSSSNSSPQFFEDKGFWYSWKEGDTLKSIAKDYSTTPDFIQDLNQIYDENDLTKGIEIWIPFDFNLNDEDFSYTEKSFSIPQQNRKRNKLNFIWPAMGRISSKFGARGKRFHYGLDITRTKGRTIRATARGKVIFSGWKRGFGNTVIISHGNNLTSLYAHSKKIYVSKGTQIEQGQKISYMGTTGRSTGIHLHFEIRKKNRPQNPFHYLPSR